MAKTLSCAQPLAAGHYHALNHENNAVAFMGAWLTTMGLQVNLKKHSNLKTQANKALWTVVFNALETQCESIIRTITYKSGQVKSHFFTQALYDMTNNFQKFNHVRNYKKHAITLCKTWSYKLYVYVHLSVFIIVWWFWYKFHACSIDGTKTLLFNIHAYGNTLQRL